MECRSGIDGVSLGLFWSRLISIADEAAATLRRTAFSTIVRESNDFAVVLMDGDGNCLAENTIGVPAFLGVLPRALRALLQAIPRRDWREGDRIITNDPWIGAGHLPDLIMAAPVFHDGKLVAFSGTVAHLPDIGGVIFSADCRDSYEEGLRIPPVKFIAAGRENADVAQLIRANVRVPDQVILDIYAQVSAHAIAARGLQEFLADAGLRDLTQISMALQERADRAMRNAIAAIPDGTYQASVTADGYDGKPTHIACELTVAGSTLRVDYAGTSDQVDRGLNSVYNYTYAYTVYPLKCALDPVTPHNEGSYRAITVDAPLGSILNPRFPAPCNARQLTGQLLTGALYKCLAQVVPERVLAESGNAPTLRVVFNGLDRKGAPFSQMLMCSGGMGASASSDGHACTAFPSNTGSGNVEAFEAFAPLVLRRKQLVADSGGRGKYRGGLGQEIEIEIASTSPVSVSLMSDRTNNPPEGLLGGEPGAPVSVALADGRKLHPKSRSTLAPGDRLILRYAGGGGFGAAAERNPELVRRDLADSYVTAGGR
jgi:N-methylhydantoinase B